MSGGIPKSDLLEMQRTFVERCAKGEFVEVMDRLEKFWMHTAFLVPHDE